MHYIVVIFLLNIYCVQVLGDSFVFPLAESESLNEYSIKLSTRRNKFKIYRRIDGYRGSDQFIKSMMYQRPHVQVIDSLSNENPPQVATISVEKQEVSPFFSNYFQQKRFSYYLFNQSFNERFGQRLDQFRHQNNGASQIGPL